MLYRVKPETLPEDGTCLGMYNKHGALWFRVYSNDTEVEPRFFKSLATGVRYHWFDTEVEAADVVPSEV
jgi:hypothetical protein